MNMGVQVYPGDPFSVLLAIYEEVELLDHMVIIFKFFEEMPFIFHSSCTILHPANSA